MLITGELMEGASWGKGRVVCSRIHTGWYVGMCMIGETEVLIIANHLIWLIKNIYDECRALFSHVTRRKPCPLGGGQKSKKCDSEIALCVFPFPLLH